RAGRRRGGARAVARPPGARRREPHRLRRRSPLARGVPPPRPGGRARSTARGRRERHRGGLCPLSSGTPPRGGAAVPRAARPPGCEHPPARALLPGADPLPSDPCRRRGRGDGAVPGGVGRGRALAGAALPSRRGARAARARDGANHLLGRRRPLSGQRLGRRGAEPPREAPDAGALAGGCRSVTGALRMAARLPHEYAELDPAIRRELVEPTPPDGWAVRPGTLYLPARRDPDVVVLAMHPRVDFFRHYLVPHLVGAGYAFFGCATRHLNNDADALHERLVLDVAGAMIALRARGFRRIVLLGNSGGGSLFAFYLEQAGRPPAERLERAPSGDRVPLAAADMPMGDGLVLLAAHPGEGNFLLDRLDPSVVDETDPIATNPRLDMYDPRNGYRPMAEGPSSYSGDFLAEFRAGQRARCQRLDATARAWCDEARFHRRRLGTSDDLPSAERAYSTRHALQRRYFL